MVRHLIWLSLLVVTTLARAEVPFPESRDRVRIAEAFHLADSVQDEVWPGWSEVPFVLLLVTEEYEYLFRHPYPSDDFQSLGTDPITGEEIFARANTGAYGLGFLATFPAVNGVNTVVIGQAENTGKTSTMWAITALHEHFHQLQFTRPWYYGAVDDLDLSGGDTSGMWQLNYPFPYDSPEAGKAIKNLVAELSKNEPGCRLSQWASDIEQMRGLLNEPDYRYLVFQLWQEGIARYTEYAVASAAVEHHRPLEAFQELEDFISYSQAHEQLKKQQHDEMESLSLVEWQRVAFYPLGAAIGLAHDTCPGSWKARYFQVPYFEQLMKVE